MNKFISLLIILIVTSFGDCYKTWEDKTKCPEVKAIGNFDLTQLLGAWYVVDYYASAEEALSYSCMRAIFKEDDYITRAGYSSKWSPGVTMNFTYKYADDPSGETLLGNITWRVDLNTPSHWTHAEDIYDGVYNTYVIDTEYKTWALLLHCAEKHDATRYLSAFVLGRQPTLPINVKSYLKDKLPKYDIDITYVFTIPHDNCNVTSIKGIETPLVVSYNNTSDIGLVNDDGMYNVDKQ